jgi:hypothetical protein
MARIMVFVDNGWLRSNMTRLGEEYGTRDYRVDYGKLPQLLTNIAARQLRCQAAELTRTYFFDGKPVNVDPQDAEAVEKQLRFYEMLREEHAYDVELFPIDFKGRRLRSADRDPGDWFQPRQCCVDVALASKIVHLSALPGAYDIAVPVLGDIDFVPALRDVRSLGKQVVVASIKGSCSAALSQTVEQPAVTDGDIIWLNDYLCELEFRRDPHPLKCQGRDHQGSPTVYTTFQPRRGEKFYCHLCREVYKKGKGSCVRSVATDALDQASGRAMPTLSAA